MCSPRTGSILYDLVGVVHHTVSSEATVPMHQANGHYLTFVGAGTGKWHCYDDDIAVRTASNEEVLGEGAYILMYTKRA